MAWKPSSKEESFWISLDDDGEKSFREWARENHKPGDSTNPTWHPVVIDECKKIDEEATK